MDEQRSGDGGRVSPSLTSAPLSYFAHTPEWMTIAAQGTSDQVQTEWLSEFDKPLRLLRSEHGSSVNPDSGKSLSRNGSDSKTLPVRAFKPEEPKFRHRKSSSGAYRSWLKMRERCYDPSHSSYANYGGRGIKVCKRWLGRNGFFRFYQHMGDRPDGMTLDRISVDGNYEPGNVKWSDKSEQQRNRRVCKK